jgi:hypothetical protein
LIKVAFYHDLFCHDYKKQLGLLMFLKQAIHILQ